MNITVKVRRKIRCKEKKNNLNDIFNIVILSDIRYVIINPVSTTILIDSVVPKKYNEYGEYWIFKNSANVPYWYYFPCNCSFAYLARKRNALYESSINSDIQIK